jgi:hypothetical protein
MAQLSFTNTTGGLHSGCAIALDSFHVSGTIVSLMHSEGSVFGAEHNIGDDLPQIPLPEVPAPRVNRSLRESVHKETY